jgi:TatD DNase family protein
MENKQMAFVDAHCHIDLFQEPANAIEVAETHCTYTIAVTNAPSVYAYTESITTGLHYVRPAIGLHPELAAARRHELPQMWRFLKTTRYVGEIGLDYKTRDESDRQIQLSVFEQILDRCAQSGNKILTIHSRYAAQDTIDAIGPSFPGRVILHWYTGTVRDLERAVDYGFYFSINPAMIKSKRGCSLIARMPRDRILTETDGPFVKVSGEPATAKHIPSLVNGLSKLWSTGYDEAQSQVMNNLRSLLNP